MLDTPTEANDERLRHELSRTEQRKLNHIQANEGGKVNGVIVKRLLIVFVAIVIGCAGVADAANAPDQIVVEVMRQHPFDYVPTVKRTIPADAKCPQFWDLMRDAGWLEKDVVKADQIIWRESRCNPIAHNKSDPNTVRGVKGSLGLFQLNVFWIQRTTYYPNGYLQTVLDRDLVPADLFDVGITIDAAQALIRYDRAQGSCGWSAWLGC